LGEKDTKTENGSPIRRWHRYKVDIRLKVTRIENAKAMSVFGRSSTLSEGGMGAYVPCELGLGETVRLELTFPDTAQEVSINAAVRSVEGFRYGLEFQRVSEEVRVMLARLCVVCGVRS